MHQIAEELGLNFEDEDDPLDSSITSAEPLRAEHFREERMYLPEDFDLVRNVLAYALHTCSDLSSGTSTLQQDQIEQALVNVMQMVFNHESAEFISTEILCAALNSGVQGERISEVIAVRNYFGKEIYGSVLNRLLADDPDICCRKTEPLPTLNYTRVEMEFVAFTITGFVDDQFRKGAGNSDMLSACLVRFGNSIQQAMERASIEVICNPLEDSFGESSATTLRKPQFPSQSQIGTLLETDSVVEAHLPHLSLQS